MKGDLVILGDLKRYCGGLKSNSQSQLVDDNNYGPKPTLKIFSEFLFPPSSLLMRLPNFAFIPS